MLIPLVGSASSLTSVFLTSSSGTSEIVEGDTIQFEVILTTNAGVPYTAVVWGLTGDDEGTRSGCFTEEGGWAGVNNFVTRWDWHYTTNSGVGGNKVKMGTNGRFVPYAERHPPPDRVTGNYGFDDPAVGDGIPALVGTVTVQADATGDYQGGAALFTDGFFTSGGLEPVNVILSSFTVLPPDPDGDTDVGAVQASFQGLGEPGLTDTTAIAVSADGMVVVGYHTPSKFEAMRWTSAGGMMGLGILPGGTQSNATGVSSDGSVVVGRANLNFSSLTSEAIRWTAAGGLVGIGDLPGGDFWSSSEDVSADGSVVVGRSISASGYEAFVWTLGCMVGLGDLPTSTFGSMAFGVSADGTIVVGEGSVQVGIVHTTEAFRWTSAGGMVGLGDLPNGSFRSTAKAISSDGSTIVGRSVSAEGFEAFRWTSLDGMVGLGPIVGTTRFSSSAFAVSGDGSVIGGSTQLANPGDAFIWDAIHGMRELKPVLIDLGLDLDGWLLQRVLGISDDGLTLVGYGENPSGDREAWVAVLGDPIPQAPSMGPTGVSVLLALVATTAIWRLRAGSPS